MILRRGAARRRLPLRHFPVGHLVLTGNGPLGGQAARAEVITAGKESTMKALKAVCAALPVLASLLLLPAGAGASVLSSGSGSFTTTGQVISVRQAGGNTIVTATEIQTLTGALTGTRIAVGIEIFHPDGSFTAHDSGTFTGTVDGRAGSLIISGASSGTGTTGDGQIVGDRGTGGLAGLHLQGTFQPVITSSTTAEGTYSVQFHFGP